jgi:hypothetical protein
VRKTCGFLPSITTHLQFGFLLSITHTLQVDYRFACLWAWGFAILGGAGQAPMKITRSSTDHFAIPRTSEERRWRDEIHG